MFNRSYQIRASRQAVKKAGGGHKVASGQAALCLPPTTVSRSWIPLLEVAEAAEKFYRPRYPGTALKPRRKKSQLALFDGKLRGIQLELFAEPDERPRQEFPSPAENEVPLSEEDRIHAEFLRDFPL